jgi:RimJ/RimL family protein N-acetyltransferase
MPANIYAEGSYHDITPQTDEESLDNVGLIQWMITVEKHENGGSEWVDDPRQMNPMNDPWCDFSLYYKISDYDGGKKWKIGYGAGIYKTKGGYWETHVGFPYTNNVEGKGLCTLLYQHMFDYALDNGIKIASSKAYSYNKDIRRLYDRLGNFYNFKKRGGRIFLRNKKKCKK